MLFSDLVSLFIQLQLFEEEVDILSYHQWYVRCNLDIFFRKHIEVWDWSWAMGQCFSSILRVIASNTPKLFLIINVRFSRILCRSMRTCISITLLDHLFFFITARCSEMILNFLGIKRSDEFLVVNNFLQLIFLITEHLDYLEYTIETMSE